MPLFNYSAGNSGVEDENLARWMASSGRILNALSSSGASANRPTKFLFDGRTFYDTTLGRPLWYDVTNTRWNFADGLAA